MVNWHPLGTIWHPLEGPGIHILYMYNILHNVIVIRTISTCRWSTWILFVHWGVVSPTKIKTRWLKNRFQPKDIHGCIQLHSICVLSEVGFLKTCQVFAQTLSLPYLPTVLFVCSKYFPPWLHGRVGRIKSMVPYSTRPRLFGGDPDLWDRPAGSGEMHTGLCQRPCRKWGTKKDQPTRLKHDF